MKNLNTLRITLLMFSIVFPLSCKNNIEKREHNKSIVIINRNEKNNTKSIKNDHVIDIDTLKLHCNLIIIKTIDANVNNLTKNDITFFLMTFHEKCNNNIEYMEYSNEMLFAVLNKYPKEVIEIMKENKEIDKAFIFNVLSNPINDKIDIVALKNKLKILNDSLANKIIEILP